MEFFYILILFTWVFEYFLYCWWSSVLWWRCRVDTCSRCHCSDLSCTADLIIPVDCWALLYRPREQRFQLEELSDLLSDGRLTLPCHDNFLSSLLFFSTQSSSPLHPLALSLFFNLIMESSTPPEQAAMLAAGEGIIFSEHVSVSRYRSTCGVNLAWRSRAILLCAREYEMLLSEVEVVKCSIWGEKPAVS